VTIFLTTHYLEEAERLCDRIALLVQGRIVALDTVEGLKARTQGATAVEMTLEGDEPTEEPEVRHLVGADVESLIAQALADARREGRRVLALNTVEPSLEDIFVQLTGQETSERRSG
jgi:ABC-2 type transport system ATP-binding protein